MRLRYFAGLGLFTVVILASSGCRRWRDDPYVNRNGDPLFQRRDTYGTPIPGNPNDPRFGGPGAPEVLTPQPYPGDPNPPPTGMPPTSSGYGGTIPISPPMTSRPTEAPPPPRAPRPRPRPPCRRPGGGGAAPSRGPRK